MFTDITVIHKQATKALAQRETCTDSAGQVCEHHRTWFPYFIHFCSKYSLRESGLFSLF